MINLLPWRLELNQRKRRNFVLSVSITVLFAIVFILIWHISLTKQIKKQHINEQKLKLLQQNYSQNIAKQKQHELLLSRLQTITNLQHKQQKIKILQEVANNIPASIHLLTIKKEDNLVTIEGIARTHQDIINFITKLKQSKLLTQIKLQEIAAEKNINFVLETA